MAEWLRDLWHGLRSLSVRFYDFCKSCVSSGDDSPGSVVEPVQQDGTIDLTLTTGGSAEEARGSRSLDANFGNGSAGSRDDSPGSAVEPACKQEDVGSLSPETGESLAEASSSTAIAERSEYDASKIAQAKQLSLNCTKAVARTRDIDLMSLLGEEAGSEPYILSTLGRLAGHVHEVEQLRSMLRGHGCWALPVYEATMHRLIILSSLLPIADYSMECKVHWKEGLEKLSTCQEQLRIVSAKMLCVISGACPGEAANYLLDYVETTFGRPPPVACLAGTTLIRASLSDRVALAISLMQGDVSRYSDTCKAEDGAWASIPSLFFLAQELGDDLKTLVAGLLGAYEAIAKAWRGIEGHYL